jgi:hypothetical protein
MGWTYIDGELPADPNKLGSIGLQLANSADMRVCRVYGRRAQVINRLQVLGKHVWMLVILGGDVLLDGIGERDNRTAPEGHEEHIPVAPVSCIPESQELQETRTKPLRQLATTL